VVRLPVSLLTFPAAVHHKAATGAGRELGSSCTSLDGGTIATHVGVGTS